MAILKGQFCGSIYSNWYSCYHVLYFKDDTDRTINAIFHDNEQPEPNTDYVIQGSWSHSASYGWQFHIKTAEKVGSYKAKHKANMEELKQMVLTI